MLKPWAARLSAALVVLATVAGARADSKKFGDLLDRVPDGANVIALIDINSLIESPMGQREKWRDQIANRPDAVLGLGAAASKLVVATHLDFHTLDERWKLCMARLNGTAPTIGALASREGGYVETIENKEVAWTPRNFYLVAFPQNVVAMAIPTSRQLLSRWLRDTLTHPRGYPAGWADRAFFRAEAGSQIVLAVELADAVSTAQVEAWLRTVDAVTDGKFEPRLIAPQLASVKSGFLEIKIDNGIEGTLHLEFKESLAAVEPIAKTLIMEALAEIGADVDDLKKWNGEVKEHAIELHGPMSQGSVRRILSILAAPSLSTAPPEGSPGAQPANTNAPPAEQPEQLIVKASQQYFRSVVDAVDALKQQRDESYSRVRFWLDRTAKQIDELPILNVDDQLLDWGSNVSLALRQMSMSINYINKDKSYRLASAPKGAYAGWWGGGSWSSVDSRSTKTQANAMINVDSTTRWQEIQSSIGEVRKYLVKKYKVDF